MGIYTVKKDGKTTYTVLVTSRINGKQVNKKRRSITSIAAAKRVEIELQVELHRRKETPDLCTWEVWSNQCIQRMKLQFKKTTVAGYESNFSKWVNPTIGHMFLNEIKSSDIHSLIYSKIQGISLESRHDVLKRIKRILTMAVEEGLIPRNPASKISVKVPESTQHVLNRTEIDLLLSEAMKRSHPFFNHWALAILTGMRNGELIALSWSDIDFENKVIAVTKSWSRVDGLGPTKSSKNRYIPISNELESFLKQLRSSSHLNNGKVLEQLDHWLSGEQAAILKDFCRSISITPVKFHDLRATFITQMLLKGVPLAKVMKIVGHATIKTTMQYLRLIAQDTQGATEELGIILPKPSNNGNLIPLFAN